jgi:copper chaperone
MRRPDKPAAVQDRRRGMSRRGKDSNVKTVVLNVPDISCEHCERTIAQTLTPMDGVSSVRVDIPTRQVRVEYDDGAVDVERLKQVLAEEDYPVESVTTA